MIWGSPSADTKNKKLKPTDSEWSDVKHGVSPLPKSPMWATEMKTNRGTLVMFTHLNVDRILQNSNPVSMMNFNDERQCQTGNKGN